MIFRNRKPKIGKMTVVEGLVRLRQHLERRKGCGVKQMVILHLKAISRYLVKVSKVNLQRISSTGMLHSS